MVRFSFVPGEPRRYSAPTNAYRKLYRMIRVVSYDAREFFGDAIAAAESARLEYYTQRKDDAMASARGLISALHNRRPLTKQTGRKKRNEGKNLERLRDTFEKSKLVAKLSQVIIENAEAWELSKASPVSFDGNDEVNASMFGASSDSRVFLYCNSILEIRGPYDKNQAKILIKRYIDRKLRSVEALEVRADLVNANEPEYERTGIPKIVRETVWKRDRGRCVQCGSVHELEYDHIIPVSKGGSSTDRNIQLLCLPCNRTKSDNI